jgi:hypothetical protein
MVFQVVARKSLLLTAPLIASAAAPIVLSGQPALAPTAGISLILDCSLLVAYAILQSLSPAFGSVRPRAYYPPGVAPSALSYSILPDAPLFVASSEFFCVARIADDTNAMDAMAYKAEVQSGGPFGQQMPVTIALVSPLSAAEPTGAPICSTLTYSITIDTSVSTKGE